MRLKSNLVIQAGQVSMAKLASGQVCNARFADWNGLVYYGTHSFAWTLLHILIQRPLCNACIAHAAQGLLICLCNVSVRMILMGPSWCAWSVDMGGREQEKTR
jgi:peptidoglycan/LPS O-acetylase OafA/YrhL